MYKFIGVTFLFFLSGIIHAQLEGYVSIKQDTSFNTEGFEVMDTFIADKKVIITGENHRYRGSNGIIKLKMLMYLYEKGVRYFMLELGAGTGYLANEYVTTGNENAISILERNFQSQNGLYELFDALKRFNMNKSYEDMIKVEGVDLTRFPIYSTKALALIIEELGCEKELNDYYEDLVVVSSVRDDINRLGFASRREVDEDFNIRAGFKTYRNRIYELSIKNLVQDFYDDTTQFQLALGLKYAPFKKIIDELKATLLWYKGEGISIQSHVKRERHMERRIAAIFAADHTAKVFGQFGRCHIRSLEYDQECYGFNMDAVAKRLEERSDFIDGVAVIPILYKEQREVTVSKSAKYKASLLLPRSASFIYDTRKDYLSIQAPTKNAAFAIVNTFSSQVTMSDIVANDYDKRLIKNQNYYRGNMSESYFSILFQHAFPNHSINQSLGIDLMPESFNYYGLAFQEVQQNGAQSTVEFSGINPTRFSSDSVNYRYSNFRFELMGGYNIVYRKAFSLYFDLGLFFGFSKVLEDRPNQSVEFTYPVYAERVAYRNPYIGVSSDLGFKFKFNGFAVFAEAGYQHDFSDATWKHKSVEVPGLSELNYSMLIFTGGISFSLN